MARTLGLFIDFEESGEEARRRFLWNLVDTEGEDREEDDPQGPENFEHIESLVLHAESRMKSGACNLNLPGVWDMGVADFRDGFIFIEAEDDDHEGLLMELADIPSVVDIPGLTVTISCDGQYFCGLENFKYRDGELIEQWFVNDRREQDVWSPCRISWKGPEDAAAALLSDIARENEGCDLFDRAEQHWRGKRLHLDEYFEETGPYMRCAVCDGEIGADYISFDAYSNDFDKREAVIELFDALAAAHPRLDFEMKLSAYESASAQWTKTFTYHEGERAEDEEQVSEDPADALPFAERDAYYRYSLPLDAADALAQGTGAFFDLAKRYAAAILYVPAGQLTGELCLEAVKRNGWALRYVPEDLKSAELCLAAVTQKGWAIQYTPEELRTAELCLAAVKMFPETIKYAPLALREQIKKAAAAEESEDEDEEDVNLEELDDADKTPERCLAAVKQRWDALGFVPPALKTAELCLAAVNFSGDALEFVPEELKTAEVCLAAVKVHGRALGFVPPALRTAELCLAAVEAKNIGGGALKYVPEELKTAEMCLAAARDSGYALEYVPEKLKTPEMCLAAVQESGEALKYVPDALKTTEMCLAAVNRDVWGHVLKHVPDALKTQEMCLAAIKASSLMIEYVPEALIAQVAEATGRGAADFLNSRAYFFKETGRFDQAIADLNKALELKPDGFTEEGYNLYDSRAEMYEAAAEYEKAIADARKALEINPDEETSKQILARSEEALMLSPEALYQRWLDFVREDPSEFRQIPEKYRTREICLIAIESYGSVCEYIPETLQSEEFFIEAVNVNTNGKALKYVPKEFRTVAVCLASVKKFPETLEFVPETLKTGAQGAELCLAAVEKNTDALEFVPEALREQVKKAAAAEESEDEDYDEEEAYEDEDEDEDSDDDKVESEEDALRAVNANGKTK